MVQWFSGSVVQWFSGSVVQWFSGSVNSTTNKGFTLSELLVSLGVLGLIAGITVPSIVISVNTSKNRAIIKEDFQVLSSIISAGVMNGDFAEITSWDIVGQNGPGSITNYFNEKLNATKQCLTGDSTSPGCKFPGGNRPGAGHNNHNARWVLANGSMFMFHHVGAVEGNGTVTFTFYAKAEATRPNEYGANPDVVFPRCNVTDNVINIAGLRLNPGQCAGYDAATWTPLLNAAMGLR